MMDLTSNNDLMSEKTGHGDNALLDTRNTGKPIKLYSGQIFFLKSEHISEQKRYLRVVS